MYPVSIARSTAGVWLASCRWLGQDWIEHGSTSPPTQFRLYGRRFSQVKRPNQQYQTTEGKNYKGKPRKSKNKKKYTYTYKIVHNKERHITHGKSPSLHWYYGVTRGRLPERARRCQARTAVRLPPQYPRLGKEVVGRHKQYNNNIQWHNVQNKLQIIECTLHSFSSTLFIY